MKERLLRTLLVLIFLTLPIAAQNLIPWPSSIVSQSGHYSFNASSRIFYDTRTGVPRTIEGDLNSLALVLAEELEMITGIKPALVQLGSGVPSANDIVLNFETIPGDFAETEAEEDQSYTLDSSASGLSIGSKYFKGVAYGTATLLQAIEESNGSFTVPGLMITDQPASEYRTIMLDLARNVHSLGVVQDVIRTARMFKIRYVHLHLTDNERFTFPFGPVTDNLTGNFTYTRQELMDLVSYADVRGVTLIPELDLPGHSRKIRDSGYLSPNDANDAQIASAANFTKIEAIIDDMLSVFTTTPYFHIGGDESAAGGNLEPFLEAMNEHLRGTPTGGKRRMLVWEGFGGSPTTTIPATGEDRVIVLSWESRYNTPWNLLSSGYQVVNASWRPMYVVGGGGDVTSGTTTGRKFLLEDMHRWNKDIFMHWEPGTPTYEDRGPNDLTLDDGEWAAANISRQDQVIGGQLLFWEGEEDFILRNLRSRAPIVSERLWNPTKGDDFATFQARARAIDERVMTIVQPVEILPFRFEADVPIEHLYHSYSGGDIKVTMRNRTKIPGVIRFEEASFTNDFNRIGFANVDPVSTSSGTYSIPLTKSGGFALRAKLFRTNGTPVEGDTWAFYNNWEQRLDVVEYDIGRQTPAVVPDLAQLPSDKIVRAYQMPILRGIGRNVEIRGQKQEALFTPPGDGEFEVSLKTQSGRATLYLDLNRNGTWEENEILIENTPNSEAWQRVNVNLTSSAPYQLRIDHASGIPRAVLGMTINGPGTVGAVGVNEYLTLPDGVPGSPARVLMIRGDYPNASIPGGSPAWQTHLLTISAGAEAYWNRHSYGKLDMDSVVTDVYRLPLPSTSYSSVGDLGAALDVLASAEHDLGDYDLIAYFVPTASPLGAISGATIPGRLWMTGPTPDQEELVRELGRALSFGKAGAIEGSSIVYPGDSRDERDGLFMFGADGGFGGSVRNPVPAPGGSPEADFSTINLPMRYQAGFVNENYIEQVTTDGVYRIFEFELNTLPSRRNLGLRVEAEGKDWWISYAPKMAERWSEFNAEGFLDGIIMHELTGVNTRILDFTPGSQGGSGNEADYIDTRDGALRIGSSFAFSDSGVVVIPVAQGAIDGLRYLDVRLANVTELPVTDIVSPNPNPATFEVNPTALDSSAVTMTVSLGSDQSGLVEYRFVETSGNPGGNSSGWQTSRIYTDSGLIPNTSYSYFVEMQDLFANKGNASASQTATTMPPPDSGLVPPTPTNTEAVDGASPWFGGRTPPRWRDRTGNLGIYSADEDPIAPNNDYLQLKTTIDGLKPQTPYEIYLEFGATGQWAIMGGLSADSLKGFSTANRMIGANQHIGLDDPSGSVTNTGRDTSGVPILSAFLGIKLSDENGMLEVFIDDPDNTAVSPLDRHRAWYSALAFEESDIIPDTTPPTPNAAIFEIAPFAVDATIIRMVASEGSDDSGPVEYRFLEISGNPGATSSGWQTSREYMDEGLSPLTQYSYTVEMRDSLGNTGAPSEAQSVMTSEFSRSGLVNPSLTNTETVDGITPWFGGRTPPIWRDRTAEAGIYSADEDFFGPNNDYLQLKTTIRDLVPGGSYQISLDFGAANEWSIMGGLGPDMIEGFSTINRMIGVNGHIGLDDSSGRVVDTGRSTSGIPIFRALLGTAVANISGEIEVFVDDPDNAGVSPIDRHRAWYVGLSYEVADLFGPWIDQFYAGVTDPNIIGFDADPNSDGIQNGIAFLMGIDPSVQGSSLTSEAQVNGPDVSWDFRFSERAKGFAPTLEYSYDMVSWFPISDGLTGFSLATIPAGYGEDTGGFAIDKVTLTVDTTVHELCFVRQSIEGL